MDPNAIRVVDIPAKDLEANNVSNLVRVFHEISQTPKYAKQLRGKVFLSFPSYDQDPRPNYQIPAIRRFIRSLDDQLSHFLYFLLGDPSVGQMQIYMLCLIEIGAGGEGTFLPSQLLNQLRHKEEDIHQFCTQIADNPGEVLNYLYINLPVGFSSNFLT